MNSQDSVTLSLQDVPDYVSDLISVDTMVSKPLNGIKVGMIRETLGDGVDAEIIASIQASASHLEDLGAIVTEVAQYLLFMN